MEELGVPYQGELVLLEDVHKPGSTFLPINPNGKLPAIYDPNTNITLWESGAIVTYLIEKYDTSHKISHASEPEKYLDLQWQHLQATGQGPYLGQAAWFLLFHSEQIESAKVRYIAETKRIVTVLDKWLDGKDWLVGDKCTYADLSFVTWNSFIPYFMQGRPGEWDPKEFPHFTKWQDAMLSRPSVKKATSLMDVKDVKSS